MDTQLVEHTCQDVRTSVRLGRPQRSLLYLRVRRLASQARSNVCACRRRSDIPCPGEQYHLTVTD